MSHREVKYIFTSNSRSAMSFTFTTTVQPPTSTSIPPEPPDVGGDGKHLDSGKSTTNMMSFRDKVLGNQALMEREKVDLIATNKAKVELVQGNRLLPMLHVEKSVMAELSVPWKDALVVKLLGKKLGYNTMKAKLENVWKLTGGFELMDVGYSYYMVKFDGEEDKNKVINGGPWMIFDHYLAVSLWSPKFNAATATIDKTMVWIRIPSLNLVYYDESVLWAVASMVGNLVKVDLHTLRVARGKFARMCVEVDLTKPVVGRVGINGDWYHVQYEGLHIICTQCGCYGHLLKDSGMKRKNITVENKEKSGEVVGDGGANITGGEAVQKSGVNQGVINDKITTNVVQSVTEISPDSLHGEWIKVERKKGITRLMHADLVGILGVSMINIPKIGKNRFKKKRPRNETVEPCKTASTASQANVSQASYGVYNGGYTAKQGNPNSTNTHVGPPNNTKEGSQPNDGLTETSIHVKQVGGVKQHVKEKDVEPWLLTVVYASPRENERQDTWNLLRHIATTEELLSRLNGIQKSSNYGYSIFLENLEKELQDQLAVTLYQEEYLWFQKSRSEWVSDGDRNTKYYHSKTIVRRRRNKIISLRSDDRSWVDDPEILTDMVQNFYINLFKEEEEVCDPIVSWTTYPTNMEAHHNALSGPIQFDECKKVLFEMGSYKAPGEDGYPALFFQQCWDTVGDSLFRFIPRRSIHHNIIVAQEMVHSMSRMKECKFPPNLVNVIQHCITSPSFKILWNGDMTDTFTPTRGIRQGDPLSPYLFVICMDRLSHMIADQVEAQYWKPMRAVACWHIWTWRNKTIFEDDFQRPSNPTYTILKMVDEIENCNRHPMNIRHGDTIFIGWKKPQEGWVKLNCDGAYKDTLELAGCGGLLRDSNGRWLTGYSRKIGTCDSLSAEMWGMYLGMQLAWRNGFHHLQVESDSKILVDMIMGNVKINGKPPILVCRIQELLKLNWQVQFKHIWREGNRSADWLANFSFSLNSFQIHVMETPPSGILNLLFDDISGACMPRNIRVTI
ncbi:hypothetical protein TSUD_271920 [Trifolium subterraneum]|uniref:Uncharacterized protein n=1 Tax=Trifolium subterraneum TaxID=3900 RepID=A0A2Z6NI18_TRISU|nr:hypothetical protein TSUD_271920 [Trifolium subterraneum]